MAVGIMKLCKVCGRGYDDVTEADGRGGHSLAYCDQGEQRQEDDADLERFNALDRDDALEELYLRLRGLERSVGSIPYDGPIG